MLSLILLAELIALYFLSRWVTIGLFELFLLLFRQRPVAVTLILILEFPGTVAHELSHLFTAEVLGVHTGKLSLEPESIRGTSIISGSVAISETDPFRRYAIGLAPVFSGMIILTAIAYFLPQVLPNWNDLGNSGYWAIPTNYLFIVVGYLLFAVSNTMFSSPQDLKGFLPFCIVVCIFVAALYFAGIRIDLTGFVLKEITKIATTLVNSLGVVLLINAGLLLLTWALKGMMTKLFHLRIA